MTTSDKGPTEEQVEDAIRVLRADYWTSIRGIAKSIADAVRSGEVNRNDVSDRIHEEADNSYWVIYTHANYRAIMCSDADPFELASDMGYEAPTLPVMAYLVVEHDLREQVEVMLPDADDDESEES